MASAEPEVMPRIEPPLCPHCGEMMAGIALFFWQVSGWLISATNCPNCRKILHTQMMPMAPTGEESRIQMPS